MAKKKRKSKKSLEPSEAIKRLLILIAILNGATSENIAEILNVDSSTIRHLISIKKVKRAKKGDESKKRNSSRPA